jgi:hypothetical protein
MTKITHEDMGSSKETPGGNRTQTYVVDDATSGPPASQLDERMAQFEAPAQQPAQSAGVEFPLPPKKPISKTLEKLIFIGRLTEEVEIGGATFEISTLTNKENNQIIKMMYNFSDAADLFTLRILTLANAVKRINGIELDDIDIEGEYESDFHKRMSIIDNLQISVVSELYSAYEKLTGEGEGASEDDEELKNS